MTANETPQQHVRNALTILSFATTDGHVTLTPDEYAAVRARLDRAVAQLEQGA